MRLLRSTTLGLFLLVSAGMAIAAAADADRDFSGRWVLDLDSSEPGTLPAAAHSELVIEQAAVRVRCEAHSTGGALARWSFTVDGEESRYKLGEESRSTAAKWEGTALLLNTLVSGRRNYTIMDRWKLSRDHRTLTVRRQVMNGTQESEGLLVYRKRAGGPGGA
jgi:hypothetical protein